MAGADERGRIRKRDRIQLPVRVDDHLEFFPDGFFVFQAETMF